MMKRCLIVLLMTYQKIISPWRPPACRFYPSCSQYAIDAITRYGCIAGSTKALMRLLRCHPFHSGGYDPATK